MFRHKTSRSSTSRSRVQPVFGVLPSTFTDGLPLPKLIIFDLDYTLWPFWVDTHVSPPLKALESGQRVKDSIGESFAFYEDVGSILSALRQLNIKVAAASRTDAPELAREMLKLLKVPVEPQAIPGSSAAKLSAPHMAKAIDFFDNIQTYPGSKIGHAEKIHDATGIAFEEMMLFDDESRNRDVERLGVVMWLVRDGVTNDEVDKGVLAWRKRNKRQLE